MSDCYGCTGLNRGGGETADIVFRTKDSAGTFTLKLMVSVMSNRKKDCSPRRVRTPTQLAAFLDQSDRSQSLDASIFPELAPSEPSAKKQPKGGPAGASLFSHPAMRALKKMITDRNFRLVVRDRSKSVAMGLFIQAECTIVIFLREADGTLISQEHLCFYLAHEVRHLLHVTEGLFPGYYPRVLADTSDDTGGNSPVSYLQRATAGMSPTIDVREGLRAERDCNRWALLYMESRFPHTLDDPYQLIPYKLADVDGYDTFLAAAEDRRSGRQRQLLRLARDCDLLRTTLLAARIDQGALADVRLQLGLAPRGDGNLWVNQHCSLGKDILAALGVLASAGRRGSPVSKVAQELMDDLSALLC